MTRPTMSFGAWWGGRRMAHSAGDSVSELKAEMTVEMAIVIANCR